MNRYLFTRPWRWLGLFVVLMMIVAAVVFVAGQTVFAQGETNSPERTRRSYTPIVAASKVSAAGCQIPGQQYSSFGVAGEPFDFDVASNADVNLGLRGYVPTDAPLHLVELGPVHDPKAPQFATMFSDERVPTFTNAYQRNGWDENCNCPIPQDSPWETTVLGMGVRPDEIIRVPDSGHDIGGGRDVMVMYAEETRITFHVGSEDSMAGYVIHVEDVCIEPDLLALYRAGNAGGRNELPALFGRQPFGRALGKEIKIAVRDTGHFLDPRSRNDWWQGR